MVFGFKQSCELNFLRYDFLDKNRISLVPLGDLHIGSKLTKENYIKDVVKYISNKEDTYTIINGDIIEGVTTSSVGNIYDLKYTSPDEQIQKAIELLTPIKDRILSITSGNHDVRSDGHDFNIEVARHFSVPFHQVGNLLQLRIGRKPRNKKPFVYTVYHTHGYGGGITKGAKTNKNSKYGTIVVSDVVITSHVHEWINSTQVFFIPDLYNKKLGVKQQYCVITPAWMSYGEYALKRGIPPATFEVIEINFIGEGKGGIEIVKHA